LGALAKTFPSDKVQKILKGSGKASTRERDMPAHVVIYYVIALSWYMQSFCREVLRCLLEGVQWLAGPAGLSQARKRLGSEPLKQLQDAIVGPLATTRTQGAGYREWRLVSLDGITLDVADTASNAAAFGKASGSRGPAGYPQIRFVSLIENGPEGDQSIDFGRRSSAVGLEADFRYGRGGGSGCSQPCPSAVHAQGSRCRAMTMREVQLCFSALEQRERLIAELAILAGMRPG
jgi:Insertion element 4 transposase N-terminal